MQDRTQFGATNELLRLKSDFEHNLYKETVYDSTTGELVRTIKVNDVDGQIRACQLVLQCYFLAARLISSGMSGPMQMGKTQEQTTADLITPHAINIHSYYEPNHSVGSLSTNAEAVDFIVERHEGQAYNTRGLLVHMRLEKLPDSGRRTSNQMSSPLDIYFVAIPAFPQSNEENSQSNPLCSFLIPVTYYGKLVDPHQPNGINITIPPEYRYNGIQPGKFTIKRADQVTRVDPYPLDMARPL